MSRRVPAAQMRRVLSRYGREVASAEKREGGRPNTISEVKRYCRALKVVWDLAKRIHEDGHR